MQVIKYAYNGLDIDNIKNLGSNSTSVRSAILYKKNLLRSKYGSDSGFVVSIKPTNQSSYANVINALDEMLICNLKTYILMDANLIETSAIKSL